MEILFILISLLVIAFYAHRRTALNESKWHELRGKLERETAECQRLEQLVCSNQERFEQILDNIPLALYIREPIRNKPTTYMSQAYETLWDQPRQQLYENGRAWLDPIHPDDLPGVLSAVEKSYQTHIPMNLEFRIVRKDGTMRWVHLQNFHINPDAEGKPQRVVGVIEDITERRLAEQDRIKLVVEQERNQFLRELISTISHDFRTPMTAINTNVYLLKRGLDNQTHRNRLTSIEQQIQRLDELLEDALTMMKLDGDTQLNRLPTDLNLALRELEPDIRPIIEHKNHSLTVTLNPELLQVCIDREWLRRAFLHLIENAAQFTPESQSIKILTTQQANFAIIEIHDAGIGISADDLPHIFAPFYRVDRSRGVRTGGAGVGLTIVQRVIDLHEGHIQVESVVGQGSVFRVLLPIINMPSLSSPGTQA